MPRIAFIGVNFVSSSIADRSEVKEWLQNFLIKFRDENSEEGCIGILFEDDILKIERRTNAYFAALKRSSGLSHLDPNDWHTLDPLRSGAVLKSVEMTLHRSNEIADALHTEMP